MPDHWLIKSSSSNHQVVAIFGSHSPSRVRPQPHEMRPDDPSRGLSALECLGVPLKLAHVHSRRLFDVPKANPKIPPIKHSNIGGQH